MSDRSSEQLKSRIIPVIGQKISLKTVLQLAIFKRAYIVYNMKFQFNSLFNLEQLSY